MYSKQVAISILVPDILAADWESMSIHKVPPIGLLCAIFLALAISNPQARAQTPSPSRQVKVQQELIQTETGFFDAWKAKDTAYFRSHIPADGVYWGEDGTFSREQQLSRQESLAKTCAVQGYSLSDFGVLPLAAGAYLLTFKAEQYVTCDGEKLPIHVNGSSVYVFKDGRWQAIFRAQVALKHQN
jgi:hypothetical protein